MFEFTLEKGSKKHLCPACSQKTFVRYVRTSGGEYLSNDVGRCDRESNCAFHKKPKDFFLDNPQFQINSNSNNCEITAEKLRKSPGISNFALPDKNGSQRFTKAENLIIKPDYVSFEILLRTLTNYDSNSFVRFLLNLFSENEALVWQAVKDYLIGTSRDGKTCFWQIDTRRKVRTGKIIAYGSDGKRRKDIKPNWIHAEMKLTKNLKADFNLKQCFFGEHLLPIEKEKPVAIVEAEKTAVIASICFPQFVWLACGSKQNLKAEKLQRLGHNRKIVLYPDADGFRLWQEIAFEACFNGQSVKVSNLIEKFASNAEKGNGFDLADYLINEQTEINQYNRYVDFYNEKLEKVLNDEKLFENFETILDEQKAVLMIEGNLTETKAESQITNPENVRKIILSL